MEEQTNPSNDTAEQTIPKHETTFEEEETSPPQDNSADPLTQIAETLSKLLVARSPREIDVSPYDGTFEAQSFFDNFDAQADRTELTYTDRLRKLPCYLQDQRLVATVQPNTIKEWFDIVSRIRGTQCATSAVYQRQVDKALHPTYHNPPPRVNNGSHGTEHAQSTAPDHAQPLYQNVVPTPSPRSNLRAMFPKSKLQAKTTLQAPRAAQRSALFIVLLIRSEEQFDVVTSIFKEFQCDLRIKSVKHVNPAAARGDVTAPKTAATTSATPASPASLNWADSEMTEVGANDDFIVVKGKKRRRGSTSPEHAARQPNKPGEQRSSQQRKRPTGPRAVPPQEIKATRVNIADARARQATTNHENYVFVELCPDIPDYSYLKAMSTLLGGPRSITQFHRMNGHFIVGLADKKLANRLVADGLEIEGTSLRVFPFRKRAERIVVANLPGFVEDSTIVNTLGQFGKVTSIAPILVKMGEFTFTDGRREAFILLRDGVRLETLPTRLTIHSKGDTLSAFLSFGIKCSKCGKQGHRRANCPALARQGNGNPRQAASPTDARPPPPPPPQQPRKPAPAPATPASPVQPATTSTEPQAIPSAHQPAEQMDVTHPAPAAHPASLAAPRPPEPRISPLDHEMSVEGLTSPPSTPARGESALKQLLKHIEETPTLSIDWHKLPGLNCKDAQQLLTSETTMKRLAPTLTEEQVATLDKLHDTFKASCPDSNSTIRKTLQKTRKETNAFHLGSGQDLCLGYSAVILAHPVAISGSGLACVFGPGVAVLRQRILWPGHIALATIDVHGEEMTAIAVHLAHEPRERNRQLELLAATAAQEEEGPWAYRAMGPNKSLFVREERLCRRIVYRDIVILEGSLGFDTAVESWSQSLKM
ncbi:hypothetical protein LAZ67_8001931 [Cordylochernes scorpioides]|uniref:CCHC-type domain-containing protein n=1 Tax=Cordylochernes scorpioides TaxID=51811 RepID=A0ABY6KQM7_9ARAC|nr:hypothetical protein LAZ67_8001931 [Cordylochernes scorpioides]